jgi:hypothetical protein
MVQSNSNSEMLENKKCIYTKRKNETQKKKSGGER